MDRLRERDQVDIKDKVSSQKALAERKREEMLGRLAREKVASEFDQNRQSDGKFISYESRADFPSGLPTSKIAVDVVNESILCPIGGELVPFHISLVKPPYQSENGKYHELRIGFNVPEGASAKLVPEFADVRQKFVRELTYRSTAISSLQKAFVSIKELRKQYADRKKEQEQRKSIVKQEDLKVDRQQGALAKVRDVSCRPLPTGGRKRQTGTLAAHINGLRFESSDKTRIDIIYANIQCCFFQPADRENSNTVLHFKLKNAIMIGKERKKQKKTDWVQIYVELADQSHDVRTGRYREEDALQEEQADRENRRLWNDRFKKFAITMQRHLKKNSELNLEFELPQKQLAFQGKTNRQQVRHYPTANSLVALDDDPPVVIRLRQTLCVVFERTHMGLKSFDLTFITREGKHHKAHRIETIESKRMPDIKTWLDKSELVYYETKVNVLWKAIINDVEADEKGFYEGGGWAGLVQSDSEGEGDDSGEESESEFEPDSSEEEESSSEDDYEAEEESEDWDSGSGEDWDELDAKARQSDRNKAMGMRDEDSDDRSRKRRRDNDRGRSGAVKKVKREIPRSSSSRPGQNRPRPSSSSSRPGQNRPRPSGGSQSKLQFAKKR